MEKAQPPPKKGLTYFTKTKYHEILLYIQSQTDQETSENIAAKLREIMNFDPNVNTYNPQKKKAYQERKKSEGLSTYITNGNKAAYYRNKEIIQQTRAEKTI